MLSQFMHQQQVPQKKEAEIVAEISAELVDNAKISERPESAKAIATVS